MVSKLMTQPVVRIGENSTAREATEKMSIEHIGSLVVTRDGNDVGMITERDIIAQIITQGDLQAIQVKDLMSTPLITVDKSTTGEDALRIMVQHGVRRLLITDQAKIVGIFTTSDVTKLVPEHNQS
jgi:predicted transcriptional regulator